MTETPDERAQRIARDPFPLDNSIKKHYEDQREKRAAQQQQEPK